MATGADGVARAGTRGMVKGAAAVAGAHGTAAARGWAHGTHRGGRTATGAHGTAAAGASDVATADVGGVATAAACGEGAGAAGAATATSVAAEVGASGVVGAHGVTKGAMEGGAEGTKKIGVSEGVGSVAWLLARWEAENRMLRCWREIQGNNRQQTERVALRFDGTGTVTAVMDKASSSTTS
eukprot:SAG11_NODE_83_length_17378_cov_5.388622_10_plen_183_part_00